MPVVYCLLGQATCYRETKVYALHQVSGRRRREGGGAGAVVDLTVSRRDVACLVFSSTFYPLLGLGACTVGVLRPFFVSFKIK